jgi:hypothetical protein
LIPQIISHEKNFTVLLCFAMIAGSCTKEYQNPTPGTTSNNNNNGGTGGTGGTGGSGGGGGGVPTIGPVHQHSHKK